MKAQHLLGEINGLLYSIFVNAQKPLIMKLGYSNSIAQQFDNSVAKYKQRHTLHLRIRTGVVHPQTV